MAFNLFQCCTIKYAAGTENTKIPGSILNGKVFGRDIRNFESSYASSYLTASTETGQLMFSTSLNEPVSGLSPELETGSPQMQVVARYNYSASESTELSIKKGEKLALIDGNGDWWCVKNSSNKVGKVPSNYLDVKGPLGGANGKKPHKTQSFLKKILGGKDKRACAQVTVSSPSISSPMQQTNGTGFKYLTPIGASSGFDDSSVNGYTMSQNPASFGATSANISPPGLNNMAIPNSQLNNNFALSNTETAVAIYNYQAQQADELNLTKGDQVTVIQKSTDGWWQVICNSKTGWIPSNYLNVNSAAGGGHNNTLPSGSVAPFSGANGHPSSNTDDSAARENAQNVDSKVDSAFLFGVIGLYRFQAQDLNELTFEKDERLDVIGEPTSDQDWWQARNSQGSMGLIPKKFVQQVPDAKPIFRRPNSGGSSSTVMMRTNVPAGNQRLPHAGTGGASNIINSIKQDASKGGPYKDRDWYYGRITRNDCEKLFEEVGEHGDFIVRESESCVSIIPHSKHCFRGAF